MMFHRKKVAVLGVVAALALSACGGGGESKSSDDGEFRVVLVSGVTGPLSTVAKNEIDALKVVAKNFNEDGGIDGRDVVISSLDSQGDPTKAVSRLQEYLSKGRKPDLVFAGIGSAETLAMLPVLTRQKIMSTATTSSPAINDPKAYPYHFMAAPTSVDNLKTLREQIEGVGAKKLAVVVPNDAFGEGDTAAIEGHFKGSGISIKTFPFNAADVDYSVAYQRALAFDPDAVFVDGVGAAVGRILSTRAKLNAVDIPTFGGSGMTNVPPTSVVPVSALKGFKTFVFTATVFKPAAERSKAAQQLIDGMKLGDKTPVFVPGLAADGLRAFAAGIKQAGSADPDDVKKAMESLKVADKDNWVTQPDGYRYSDTVHYPQSDGSAYSWITPLGLKDGLWTTE